MKRNISDLLDGFPVDDVELQYSTPLSSQRIKELTMKKVNKAPRRRILPRFLVVAAIIAALTTTAFAAEVLFNAGDVLRDILTQHQKEYVDYLENRGADVSNVRETLSQGQIEVINELGTVFTEQSYTSEGTTMTLVAAYGGADIVHLYFEVEAPEGTVLPDGILYDFYDYNNDRKEIDHEMRWYVLEAAEDAPYDYVGYGSMEIEALPDDDPTDNKKDFHVTLLNGMHNEAKYNDGYSKYFNVTGIYEQVVNANMDEDAYRKIAPGNFRFDFGIVNEVDEIELDVKGLSFGGEKTREWTHDSPCLEPCNEYLTGETDEKTGLPIHSETWTYSETCESMKISPLGVEVKLSYPEDQNRHTCMIDVVMKDGTSPLMEYAGGVDGGTWMTDIRYFVTPIDLEEIDYILIGDPEIDSTHKIYLPK